VTATKYYEVKLFNNGKNCNCRVKVHRKLVFPFQIGTGYKYVQMVGKLLSWSFQLRTVTVV